MTLDHHHCSVLVVDDDPSIRSVVREILETDGYAVVDAEDGVRALEQVERNRPDVILLDMRMPRLDGWGVARALRQRGLRVPFIVMTAAVNARRWADDVGANGALPKPFELEQLLEQVDRNCPHH